MALSHRTCWLRYFVVLAAVGLLPTVPATGQDLLEATISPVDPGTADVISIDVFGRFSCWNYQLTGAPEVFVDGSTVVIDVYYVDPGGCLPVVMDFQTKTVIGAMPAGLCQYEISLFGLPGGQLADTLAGSFAVTCYADTDGDELVDADDLAAVLASWGTDGSTGNTDIDGNGHVDVDDLIKVILAWGSCG
jgi:hypothetical protein